MSQKNINFLGKSNIQYKKTKTPPGTSSVVFDDVQKILDAQIDTVDIIDNKKMPIEMLGTQLQWRIDTLDDCDYVTVIPALKQMFYVGMTEKKQE